jgi:O-acetylhomoserine (thiol)-lyase
VRRETLAVHGGYEGDPTTRAVAVPIYQTAAYEFDSAEHGAALFNLEVPGYRYSRINNPTVDVLDKRVAALEGGVGALCVASGQAALHYAVLNLTAAGANIISVPQLYGTTHTLFSHLLPSFGIEVKFAKSDSPADIEPLIDEHTRGVFCESVGNPAGNICDIEALAEVAHAGGVPLVVDNTVATPILLRPIEYGADIVVHSLTKFMGGHGTTLGGAIVDSGKFPWKRHADRFRQFCEPDLVSRARLRRSFRARRLYRALPQRLSAHDRVGAVAVQRVSAAARHRDGGAAGRAPCRECPPRRRVPARRQARRLGQLRRFPDSPYHRLAEKYLGGRACSLLTFGTLGGSRAASGSTTR